MVTQPNCIADGFGADTHVHDQSVDHRGPIGRALAWRAAGAARRRSAGTAREAQAPRGSPLSTDRDGSPTAGCARRCETHEISGAWRRHRRCTQGRPKEITIMSFETINTDELNAVTGGLGPILSGLLGGALQGAGGAIANGQIGNGGILKGLLSGGLQGAASGIQALGRGGQGQAQGQGPQPQGGA